MPPDFQEPQKSTHTGTILVVIVLVVILGVLYFYRDIILSRLNPPQAPAVELQHLSPESTPERFPEDFPMEKAIRTLTSYNAQNSDSIQATRTFVTGLSVAESDSLYTDYLKKSGWNILLHSNTDPNMIVIAALKGTDNASINIHPQGGETVVEANFTFKK